MLVQGVVSGETSIRQSEHGREVEVRLSGRRVREMRATGTSEAAEVVVKDGDGRETRRWVRGRFMVRGAWDAAAARRSGYAVEERLPGGWTVLRAATAEGALTGRDEAAGWAGVVEARVLTGKQQVKRVIPNDPLFASQWHLNSGGAFNQINVTGAWDSVRGTGVRIGIVDDGMQTGHPDLQPNADTAIDHDWNDGTPDTPEPNAAVDHHGTACAGVAAARGGNGIGVSGSAPGATLVGLRLIAGFTDDADEAAAMSWRNDVISVYSNSWGPDDDAQTLEGPGPATAAAMRNGALTGRQGKGCVYVWAAGNGGGVKDNSNKDGYANSIYAIAVGASTSGGTAAGYSEAGSNVAVCAPSSGGLGIVTTDLTGAAGYNSSDPGSNEPADLAYTGSFGGTSSAAPLVAGVVALMLEANPQLGWRDVKEILMRSARQLEPASGWTTNGGGIRFHDKFGAGQVDAGAAVAMARGWSNRPAMLTESLPVSGINVAIPNNMTSGVVQTFTRTGAPLVLEHVQLTLTATHVARGELEVTLTSPTGMVSRLMTVHGDTGAGYAGWTFSSVRHWGELASGTWTLRVADRSSTTTSLGTLTGATLTLHGIPGNVVPEVTGAVLSGPDAAGHSYSDRPLTVSEVMTSDAEGNAVTVACQWQVSGDRFSWADVGGATGLTWTPGLGMSGKWVRVAVTASDAGGAGAPWFSEARPVNRRPRQDAVRNVPWGYDSDLLTESLPAAFVRAAVINEISQGQSGVREWVELLVTRTSDLRGWTLTDRTGTYTTFGAAAVWAAVPAGMLIVIHNGGDRDPSLPAADSDPAGGSMICAHNNSALFTAGTWGGLSNSSADNVQVRDAGGVLVDGVSFNSDAGHAPAFGTFAVNRALRFNGGTEGAADAAGSWSLTATATAADVTPGLANGGDNSVLVTGLRTGPLFAAEGLPVGLGIDPVSGLVSGTVTGATGLYAVTLRRGSGAAGAVHGFPLMVSDPATDELDEDADGLENVLELALLRDPRRAEAGPGFRVLPGADGLGVEWRVPAGATGLRVVPESSSDMVTWHGDGASVVVLGDETVGDVRTVSARPATGSGKRLFFRLRVETGP